MSKGDIKPVTMGPHSWGSYWEALKRAAETTQKIEELVKSN